jgi:aminoglycoside phosphotransferase family enzyme
MTGRAPAPRIDRPAGASHLVADQGEAIAFLSEPASYGPDIGPVERIVTHGAMVFLAGERAYKMKRAVRYPYMDFATLELRKANCERERELNRRSAPELYLGVEAVTRGADGQLALGGPGEPVEWLVVMKRFDQNGLCDRLARDGRLTPELMAALADEIAAFHDGAERLDAATAPGGGAAGLGAVIEDNLAELAERPDLFPSGDVAAFARASRAALSRHAPLLEARLAAGHARRCHGDLHLRNICVIDGRPRIFDAIEFNDAIACIDVLYDLAFLIMDLEHRGLRGHANLVLNRYLQHEAEVTGLAALPLFLSVRAAVRAKVGASIADSQSDALTTQALYDEAGTYFHAARAYLEPAPPRLVAIGGLSGTGKTSLARELAPGLGAPPGALHLRSDVLRKALAGAKELDRLPPESYSAAASAAVYGELLRQAGAALDAGRAVIADAVYARPAERAAIEDLARELGVPFHGLWLDCPEPIMVARIGARSGDASDATAEVLREQLGYDLGEITWSRLEVSGELAATTAAAEGILAQPAAQATSA